MSLIPHLHGIDVDADALEGFGQLGELRQRGFEVLDDLGGDDAGGREVVGLEAPAGYIATGGSMVLVVADADWYLPSGSAGDEAPRPPAQPAVARPVVWEDPTPAGFDALRKGAAAWSARLRGVEPDVPDAGIDPSPGHDADDDPGEWPVPRPVWRLDGAAAVPVDLGGDVHALAVLDGVAYGVVRRPSDPEVRCLEPGGWISYRYPGVVVRWDPATGVQVVAEVEDCGGEIVVDGERVWLAGFAPGDEPVRELDTTRLTLGPPVPLQIGAPVGVRGGAVLELEIEWAAPSGGPVVVGCCLRRTVPGGPALAIGLPPVEPEVAAARGDMWFQVWARPELMCVDAAGAVRRVHVDVDCRSHAPPATVPDGLDVRQFETDELAGLREAFLGGWVDDDDARDPFIAGIELTAIELRGGFPGTRAVALFRADDRPGLLFGRRWDLYDDLGNPQPLGYADIGLMEDIEAAGYGLPPAEACVPDHHGIVWF